MTAEQFIKQLNDEFGICAQWPATYAVSTHTYASCCLYVFQRIVRMSEHINYSWGANYMISLGKNRGLMFKGIELILDLSIND